MKPAKRIIKLPLFPIEYFLFVGEDIKDAQKEKILEMQLLKLKL